MFKLVIVEDEELLRMGLVSYIEWQELGFELVGDADDGVKGLEIIREKRPDVLITDIKMPHMTGIEMTEILKKEMPDLRVIIISGYDEFDYAKRALQAGVSEYILKPIKMANLKEVVCKVRDDLEKHRSQQAEYLELKNSQQENIRIKKNHLYGKLLLHQCSMAEVSEERKELAEYLEEKYYAVGVVAISGFSVLYMDCDYSVVMEKDLELERLVEKCLKDFFTEIERSQMELLRANHGERLLCICCDERDEVKKLICRIQQAFEKVTEGMERLEITFGQVAVNLEGLEISYRSAYKICEQKFLRDWQEVAMEQPVPDQMIQFMNYDTGNLCYEIKSGSEQGIRKAFQDIKDRLSRQNVTSYLQLILLISNIYYVLVKIPEEAGGTITDVTGNPQEYYYRLIGKMKRDDMLGELEEFCIRLHHYFMELSMDRKQEVMKRINVYLREHFSEESLSMKDVADYAYISVSYLGMIIRKETGKTFIEYLTDIRIEKAKQYLVSTNMKNYEVAESCGYSTPSYFSTVFKGVCGLTPSEYRNQMKKVSE